MQLESPVAGQVPRRPLKSRQARWAQLSAAFLIRLSIRPNHISIASVVFATFAAACLLVAPRARTPLLLAAAACIQLRLLCNLMDGMVAVEGGFRSPSGEIYNDLPDRISDVLILVAAGYSLAPSIPAGPALGVAAAFLAVLTAYVRVLGGAAGLPQDFSGPMAKPHRMAVLTAASLLSALKPSHAPYILAAALVIVALGSLATLIRRTARIVSRLEKAGLEPKGKQSHANPDPDRRSNRPPAF